MKKKLLLLILCAFAAGSMLEARRSGGGFRHGGGRRGGFHRSAGIRHGGHRWRRSGWWGGSGLGVWPYVSVVGAAPYYDYGYPTRPASLDAFISEFGREPSNVTEFCNWISATGRSPRQCDLYRAYR